MTHWVRLILPLLILCGLGVTIKARAAEPSHSLASVLIIASDRGGVYEETIDRLRSELLKRVPDARIAVTLWHEAQGFETGGLIVTLGAKAAIETGAGRGGSLVLNTLLTSQSFKQIHEHRSPEEKQRITAVFLDQAPARQIALIREALPDWQNIALISGPSSAEAGDALETEARRYGFSVRQRRIESERHLYDALQETLATPAALIALPDRDLFNSRTIQNILLTSYRRNSPVIGFSSAYVRAGALIAIYSRPDQIAEQSADAIAAILHGTLPPPSFPLAFEVGINQTVARSLRIRLDAADEIEARLMSLEQRAADD